MKLSHGQSLSYGGRQLVDSLRLADYNIHKEATLQVMERLNGGAPDPLYFVMVMISAFLLYFMNFYFLAHYSHHGDAQFGMSTPIKMQLVSDSLLIYTILNFCRSPVLSLHNQLFFYYHWTFSAREKVSKNRKCPHFGTLSS